MRNGLTTLTMAQSFQYGKEPLFCVQRCQKASTKRDHMESDLQNRTVSEKDGASMIDIYPTVQGYNPLRT